MLSLIFAVLLALILPIRVYEIVKYKEKPDGKTILYMILVTLFVISVFLEKLFKISI